MKTQAKRAVIRFPHRSPMSYMTLGYPVHLPEKGEARGEILDLSDMGMRMATDRRLDEGVVLLVKVPLMSVPASVPSLAEVRWVHEKQPGSYEAGLKFVVQ